MLRTNSRLNVDSMSVPDIIVLVATKVLPGRWPVYQLRVADTMSGAVVRELHATSPGEPQ
jgi:hypothetical protein